MIETDPSIAAVSVLPDVVINSEFDRLSNVRFPGPGQVTFDLASLSGTTPAQNLYLATLKYTGIAPGLSTLSATDTGLTFLNDGAAPTQIVPSSANGSILVTGASQPVPEPTSAVLLLGLLTTAGVGAGLKRFKRRMTRRS